MCAPLTGSIEPLMSCTGERAHPALAVRAPLGHVADERGEDVTAVAVLDELPEGVELGRARLRVRAEHVREGSIEAAAGEHARERRPERRGQQLLDRPRAVRLGKEAAVEEGDREPLRRGARVVAREQLLRDGVAVVVREHVVAIDAQRGQHALDQVGLLEDRVAMRGRLGGEAEAEQIGRHAAEARAQRGPDARPVVARGRKAVQQQQGRLLARAAVGDEQAMTAHVQHAPAGAPRLQVHATHGATPVGGGGGHRGTLGVIADGPPAVLGSLALNRQADSRLRISSSTAVESHSENEL
jgi:hypothetical protein